jgi:hypothetical protein
MTLRLRALPLRILAVAEPQFWPPQSMVILTTKKIHWGEAQGNW